MKQLRKLIQMVFTQQTMLLFPQVKAQSGFWVDNLPVVTYAHLADLVSDLPNMLTHTKPYILPTEEAYPQGDISLKQQQKALGVTSYRGFSNIAKFVDIEEKNGIVTIEPLERRKKPNGFFAFEEDYKQQVPLQDHQGLIEALQRAMSHAKDLADWIAAHPPRKRKKKKEE